MTQFWRNSFVEVAAAIGIIVLGNAGHSRRDVVVDGIRSLALVASAGARLGGAVVICVSEFCFRAAPARSHAASASWTGTLMRKSTAAGGHSAPCSRSDSAPVTT